MWLALIVVGLGMARWLAAAPTPSSDAKSNIFRDAVVRTIQSHLVSIGVEQKYRPAAEQLEMVSPAVQVDAGFSVHSLHWDALQAALYFQMNCAPRKACTPFLVRAHVPVEVSKVLLQRFRPVQEWTHSAMSREVRANRCEQPSVLVRAGKPARLLLRRQHIKLTTLVMALECGAAGQQVRARGVKTSKLFDAEVVGENLLSAAF